MRHSYSGQPYGKMFYSTEEEKEAILNGEIFQTTDFGWYYKSIPYHVNSSRQVPNNLVRLELDSTTSKFTKQWWFYELVEDPNAKVYYGDGLRNKIFADIKLWMRDINSKMRAFSGKSFLSYINAIPEEFLMDENFVVAAKFIIGSELDARASKRKIAKGLAEGIKKMAVKAFDKAHADTLGDFEEKAENLPIVTETLDKAHDRAVEKANKGEKKK